MAKATRRRATQIIGLEELACTERNGEQRQDCQRKWGFWVKTEVSRIDGSGTRARVDQSLDGTGRLRRARRFACLSAQGCRLMTNTGAGRMRRGEHGQLACRRWEDRKWRRQIAQGRGHHQRGAAGIGAECHGQAINVTWCLMAMTMSGRSRRRFLFSFLEGPSPPPGLQEVLSRNRDPEVLLPWATDLGATPSALDLRAEDRRPATGAVAPEVMRFNWGILEIATVA